ncbi:MAG TPA: sulfatase-like hydrolase/transferase [Thermomicrobiales bacterium]|nr:sulfatase-like hydrolase/transferase [Thermomicrobiales bacterium]
MGSQHDDLLDGQVAGPRISRRDALRGIGGAGMALAGAGALPGAVAGVATVGQAETRPNILVIVVDEMRDWQWFPDQAALNQAFPNLARLQDGAVRFGRHYTCTNMCSPARGSLVTGLYSHQTGLVLTQGGNVDDLTGPGLVNRDDATPQATPADEVEPPYPSLDPRFPTWGTLLREQGYETYWWGKWHLNDADCDMEQYGFAGGTCPSPNGGPGGGMMEDPNIADQAIEWLESQGDRGPWCTTVSFVNPHDIQWYPRWTRTMEGQNDPPPVFGELPPNYETGEDLAREHKPRLQLAALMGLIQVFGEVPHRGPNFERHWIEMLDLYHQLHGYLDREIGRVLDALEAQPGVAENTIIVFTSDHGEYCGSHGLRGKGAGIYEEGIRVPLWVKDPTGQFAAQPEVPRTQLTSSVDLTPMLLTLASSGGTWREQPELAYLANRLDLTALLRDASAPGRDYALHATDEDGFEYGPRLFPFLQDAPFHVLGLITEDAKLGVYTDWADDSDEILPDGQEVEFYDYGTEEGRLELANTAGEENQRFTELYQRLMTEVVPNELRAPLPEALEAARQETMAATVARIAYDRAAARE